MNQKVSHELEPIFDEFSKVLILGTMPSVKSREVKFYYGHPQNRFWSVLESVFEEKIVNKKEFLLKHHIALWDVLAECDINGSSDASIKNGKPNNLSVILEVAPIKAIFTTGRTAHKYYEKYFSDINILEICLPSTSPANCRVKERELIIAYKEIKKFIR